MKMNRLLFRGAGVTVLTIGALAGCGREQAQGRRVASSKPAAHAPAHPADTAPTVRPWVAKPIVVEPDPKLARTDSLAGRTPRLASEAPSDSAVHDSSMAGAPAKRAAAKLGPGERRRYALTPTDSARWPVKGPALLPGSLLPENRIIAFYGNPKSSRMGILGELPPSEMLPKLERTAHEWAKADPGRKTLPALHLIATVAQGAPGAAGKYRLRHSDQLIEQVLGWAEERGWLVFLDVQIGHSTVPDELPHLVKYLERPYVHLALDPEFAMKLGGVPGRRIGTLDAEDVNYAVRLLAGIVDREKVPPKVLVVHRFTQRMLTNHDKIQLDARVQVVVDMDGFGAPYLKEDAYKFFIVPEPVQYTGFKLFFKNDKPMMTPSQVLKLWPVPSYIQYQ
ncbi:MAG: hypothetical protein ACTHM9_07790 [Gemmatimonadales bacterium]